jgi:hypothetical protein
MADQDSNNDVNVEATDTAGTAPEPGEFDDDLSWDHQLGFIRNLLAAQDPDDVAIIGLVMVGKGEGRVVGSHGDEATGVTMRVMDENTENYPDAKDVLATVDAFDRKAEELLYRPESREEGPENSVHAMGVEDIERLFGG